MNENTVTLEALHVGASGVVCVVSERVAGDGMARRLMDIGCIVGAPIRKLSVSPFGDPCAYLICGAIIAIRARDAAYIRIYPSHDEKGI